MGVSLGLSVRGFPSTVRYGAGSLSIEWSPGLLGQGDFTRLVFAKASSQLPKEMAP